MIFKYISGSRFSLSLLVLMMLVFSYALCGQNTLLWYESDEFVTSVSSAAADCEAYIQKKDNGKEMISFPTKPLFIHTTPEFQEWSKGKYLLEGYAHIYANDDNVFLLLKFRFNTINAKKTYGILDSQARLRLYLGNGENVYLQNIEKDKGSISRQEGTSDYLAVLPLEKSEKRLLSKNFLIKAGIQWENGYQEYEVHNIDLIMNQLNCLNEHK